MNYQEIKISGEGFLCDGMYVPKDSGNRHYLMALEDILQGSVVAPEQTSEEIEAVRQIDISETCRALIYAQYSQEDQRNFLAERTRSTTTAERQAEIDQVDSWIMAMVDLSRSSRAGSVQAHEIIWPDPPSVIAP